MKNVSTVLVALSVLCLGNAVGAAPVQWLSSAGGNDHWYELIVVPNTSFTWYEAEALAEARGGYLVTVTSQAETDFLASTLGGTAIKHAWLGAYQDRLDPSYSEPGGGWKWITGEPWSYTHWLSPGEPNNVGVYEDWIDFHNDAPIPNGYWADVPWNSPNHDKYLIEWNAEGPDPVRVPEPSSLALALLTGMAGIGAWSWRKGVRRG